jgi:hypothetical protein
VTTGVTVTDHDVIRRDADTTTDHDLDERTAAFVDFLTTEFPQWQVAVDATATWGGDAKELWVATRDGHHPQSALTAGKLHRRLSDYEERLRARHAGDN